jgi:nucleotide-binding universal stress UspA family protein
MDTNLRNILVPWDFTPSSDFALQHANRAAKVMDLNVSLLHIIGSSKDEAKYSEKLKEVAKQNELASGVHTKTLIQHGDVLKTISELANVPDTSMVVMKTDGVKGIEKYTGSRAMKIMRGAKCPFLIVQDVPKVEVYKKIVYPIDYRSENKELLSVIINLLKVYLNPKIYLYRSFTNDKAFKKNINNTVNFARTLFESKGIEYEVVLAPEGKEYAASVNDYANSIEADLVIVQLQRNLTLTKFIFGVKEQAIITNQFKIPVMCINQRENKVYAGFH